MLTKEILKKENYYKLTNMLRYNPDMLDEDTSQKIKLIEEMFEDIAFLRYRNNEAMVLKLFLQDQMTIEQISDKMNISTRHVDRLKKHAIDRIIDIFEPRPCHTKE